MDGPTAQRRPSQRPDTDEPEGCVEVWVEDPDGHELTDRVARFVDKVQHRRVWRADSPGLAVPVAANVLLDDREIQARRLRWHGAGATLAAVACLALVVLYELAPPVERTHSAHRTTVEATYTIDETIRVGEMTIFVSHIVTFARRVRLHLFVANPGDEALPGGVTLSDGDGNEIEVIPADHKVRSRTIEHRRVEFGEGVNPRLDGLRLGHKRTRVR